MSGRHRLARERAYRSRPPLPQERHAQLWRLVQGAVADALHAHPDWVLPKGRERLALSITKRVVGQVLGAAKSETPRG